MVSFYVNDIDISEYIVSLSSNVCFEENKLIGNTPSMEIELVVDNRNGVFNSLLDTPFIMKRNNEQVGVYYILDKPEKMTGEITLVLYDSMIYSNMKYESNLEYPTSILNVLNEISTLLNVEIDIHEVEESLLNKEVNVYDSGESIRTHLGYIGELCACNVMVINNVYCFRRLGNTIRYELNNSDVESFIKHDMYTLSGVRYDDGIVVIEAGNHDFNVLEIDTNNIYISNQEDIDFIYSCLNGISFMNVENMKMVAIDELKLGEFIQLKDEFIYVPLSIKTNYYHATYDISEINGFMNNKINNETNIFENQSTKIKKIQTILNKNEGTLEILSTKINTVEKQTTHISDTQPNDINQLWLDTSQNPNTLKYYDGIDWVKLNSNDEELNELANQILQETSSNFQLSNESIQSSIQEIQTSLYEQETKIQELSQNLELTSEGLLYQKTQTEALQNEINEKVSEEKLSEYIRFDGASIELGMSSNTFKTVITNEQLAFYQGSIETDNNKIAYMSNNEMYIKKANIDERINIGEFQFADEGDLGFSLI